MTYATTRCSCSARPAATAPLRIGRIGYLNVLPVHHALEAGLIPGPEMAASGPPARMNALLRQGELDLSACSSIEYARDPASYLLLPDLSIASRGHVKSVLLLSRLPVARLSGREVLVSSETSTSAALLDIFLRRRLGVDVRFATGSVTDRIASDDPPDAFLAIGDEALRLADHPDYPHLWDLGSVWLDWTGLPFVFGVWVVRREAAQARPAEVAAAVAALHAGRDWGREHSGTVSAIAAEKLGMSPAFLRAYFDGLSYNLGPTAQEGLARFYAELARSGIIPKAPPFEFFRP